MKDEIKIILNDFADDVEANINGEWNSGREQELDYDNILTQAKTAIEEWVKTEIIGKDDVPEIEPDRAVPSAKYRNKSIPFRNYLRLEQRQRLGGQDD